MEENVKEGKILVIDDESSLAELISDFCANLGYSVTTLTNSEEAFETARRIKPNLITLDLQMPKTDGFEVLRQLKMDPETRGIPVIIVSVLAGEAERQGLLAAAQVILAKPINFRKFKDSVGEYVKEKTVPGNPE